MILNWLMVLFLIMGSSFAVAQPSTADLSGTWYLDKEASDSMAELLEAQGVPPLERHIYCRINVTLNIQQTVREVRIEAITSVHSDVEVLQTDGSTQEREVPYLGKVSHQSHWTDEGRTLLTTTEFTGANGRPAHGKVTRWLDDGGKTMLTQVAVRFDDGKVLQARRIFRRPSKKRSPKFSQ